MSTAALTNALACRPPPPWELRHLFGNCGIAGPLGTKLGPSWDQVGTKLASQHRPSRRPSWRPSRATQLPKCPRNASNASPATAQVNAQVTAQVAAQVGTTLALSGHQAALPNGSQRSETPQPRQTAHRGLKGTAVHN